MHEFCLLDGVYAVSLDYLHRNLSGALNFTILTLFYRFGFNFEQLLLKSVSLPPDLLADILKQLFFFFLLLNLILLL